MEISILFLPLKISICGWVPDATFDLPFSSAAAKGLPKDVQTPLGREKARHHPDINPNRTTMENGLN